MSGSRGSDLTSEVVVIGAGFAGLVAGALLARDGFLVRVLERDIHPGGCAASYIRQTEQGAFRFAVGATLGAGLERGGVLGTVFSRLGMEAVWAPLDPAIRVHLPDRSIDLATTRPGWQAELTRAFPGGLQAKRAFWRDVQRLADAMHFVARRFPSLPLHSPWDVLDTARGLHPGLVRVLLGLRHTVGDLLERHGLDDAAHTAFIDGQLLDSMQVTSGACALPNGAYALEVYRYGAQYVFGGLSSLAEQLVASIRAHGGEVHYATRARAILLEGGRVVGVDAGRVFRARSVISTAPLPDTAALLGQACPAVLARRVENLGPMWSAFCLYLGLHESGLPSGTLPFEQHSDFDDSGLHENFLVSTSPAWDRARAPVGFRAVTVSTHVRPEEWFALPREHYKQRKAELERHLLERLARRWPGVRDAIVTLESGSPRTWQAFTLHSLGRVGGIPQTVGAANFAAQHHTCGVPGLFLAGETIFPGQGTLGVSVSGFNAYRATRRLLTGFPYTRHSPFIFSSTHSSSPARFDRDT